MNAAIRRRLLLACALVALAGCSQAPPAPARAVETGASETASAKWAPQRLERAHLPNACRLTDKVISGGLPQGRAAFAELQALGVRTIVSVDGARPDVALAEEFGLRYVHLPHGYDGISAERAEALAKAVRDLPGPIYIHCHHGKHRSPAAAAVACVGCGLLDPSQALRVLQAAGTSENYRGLYAAARAARRFDDALLDALPAEFPATVELPPLNQAMVAIEHLHDRLQQSAADAWAPWADHPDLDAAHEALLLREQFTELLRTPEAEAAPARYQDLLRESETAATELEAALLALRADPAASPEPAAAALERIAQRCQSCHREFRDVPLGEK